ncbi:MAG: hypothetical protein WB239_15655 [Acidimicrobiia bacterium]
MRRPYTTIPSEGSDLRPLRVASIGFIGAVILAASAGLLGVQTAETRATGHGLTLTVDYARLTRPGLATPLVIGISTEADALPDQLTVRLSSHILEMLDLNDIEPTPQSSFSEGPWTWWTFDAPRGSRSLVVRVDARLEPAVQWGGAGIVALEEGGVVRATANVSTWVLP